jgi:glycosyltransferase involved in cell wall biosynthesis
VTVAVVPSTPLAAEQQARGKDFVRRFAKTCLVLPPTDPVEAMSWPSMLLATPAGRRRARELYPLPATCPSPSPQRLRALHEIVKGVSLVHVMRSYLLPCLDFLLDRRTRPRLTLDLDELDSAVYRQLADDEEAGRFERLEAHYIPLVDHVYTAADEDARFLREQFASSASVVPNAARLPTRKRANEKRFDLLFVGNLSYAPNIDGMRWFCDEVQPLLGGCEVAVVGSDPPEVVRRLGQLEGVTVAADVPEVDSWYAASRVAIVPIRIGGGSRIKVSEALAHELPIVATGRGAEGLAVGEDNGILVADTPAEFAAQCVRLLNDAPEAARIAAAGRARVKLVDDVIGQIDLLTRHAVRGAEPC